MRTFLNRVFAANLNRVFTAKDNGDKAIVVEVGLAVIAVVLLVIFQKQMSSFITTLVSNMTTEIGKILTSGVTPGV